MKLYEMRGYDTSRKTYVYWTSVGKPDLSATGPNAPLGSFEDIQVIGEQEDRRYPTFGYEVETIQEVQAFLGVIPDGLWGPETRRAFHDWLDDRFIGHPHVEGLNDLILALMVPKPLPRLVVPTQPEDDLWEQLEEE